MVQRRGAVESVVMRPAFWDGRRVLISGHTGFKGAWLCAWLDGLGAQISGFALPPRSTPSMHELIGLSTADSSHIFDINDRTRLANLLAQSQPDVVFHMAAQSLVRLSYKDPVETFATNVVGTVTLLDAIREIPSVQAIIVVTSDKCYENHEWVWGYRENDRLGGRDPYSASKGCAEIAARSMQKSFFAPYAPGGHPARIATVRAGNVIGGGDWSEDRLVPDIVRGCLGPSREVRLREPGAVRPWQHVLEPLRGYLEIAERLVEAPDGVDEAWNFGPEQDLERPVHDLARAMVAALKQGEIVLDRDPNAPHEARQLRLDCAKAHAGLGWRPLLSFDETIRLTAEWYLAWTKEADMRAFTQAQISKYMNLLASSSTSTAVDGPG